MPEEQRSPRFQIHEVVQDLSSVVDGQPDEMVFVEEQFGVAAVLRPLGETGPERRVRLSNIRPLDPRQIAPGTAGKSRRRPMDGWPV